MLLPVAVALVAAVVAFPSSTCWRRNAPGSSVNRARFRFRRLRRTCCDSDWMKVSPTILTADRFSEHPMDGRAEGFVCVSVETTWTYPQSMKKAVHPLRQAQLMVILVQHLRKAIEQRPKCFRCERGKSASH